MRKLKCLFANHQEQKIISICLDKDCQQKRLCCFGCISQFHGGHDDKLIEVKQFKNFMNNLETLGNQQGQAAGFYTFAQNYRASRYTDTLQFIQCLEKLSKLIASFQKIVQERLQYIKGQSLQKYAMKFKEFQYGIDSWNEFIEIFLEYIEANNGTIIHKNQQNVQLNQMESRSIQIIKESEEGLLKLIQSFNATNLLKPLRFNDIPIEFEGSNQTSQAIISQDGSIIVSQSLEGKITVWDAQTKQIRQTLKGQQEIYNFQINTLIQFGQQHIALSSNNKYLAYYQDQIYLYDLKQNKLMGMIKDCEEGEINCIIFSQDTQYLLAGGWANKLIVLQTFNMKQVLIFETDESIQVIIISPDNKFISCMTHIKGQIYIWDFQTKMKLIQENNIHKYGLSLCSSADSQIYITSGSEGLIKIWKLNQLHENKYALTLTKQIKAGSMKVNVLLTMDDQYIISMCNFDGKIMIYQRQSGYLIQKLDSGQKSEYFPSISISKDMNVLVSTNFTKDFKVWTRK